MYELVIVADTNDADYVTCISDVSLDIIEDHIKPVATAIKNFPLDNYSNWPNLDHRNGKTISELYPQLTLEQINLFREYCPSFEGGIHSIESITYYLKPEKIELL